MPISSRDAKLLAAVDNIYSAAADPAAWPAALQAISGVFGDVGTVLIWFRDDGSFGVIASPSLADCVREYMEEGWNRRDTLAIKAVERGLWYSHDTVSSYGFLTDEEWSNDPFFKFRARHGLGHVLATGVSPDPNVAVAISVQRAMNGPRYTSGDAETLTLLGRHVERALRLSMRLMDAEAARVGLGEALARIRVGVFALDSLKRVVFANPAGKRILGHGLTMSGGRLLIARRAGQSLLDRALHTVIEGGAAQTNIHLKPIVIGREHSASPLVLYVLPVPAASATAKFLTHTRAIVLAIRHQADDPADPALVRDLLGVTLGEARVAALVGCGLGPRDAAQKLGVSEETVRTSLKRVFSKVGVSRQSELTALLASMTVR